MRVCVCVCVRVMFVHAFVWVGMGVCRGEKKAPIRERESGIIFEFTGCNFL